MQLLRPSRTFLHLHSINSLLKTNFAIRKFQFQNNQSIPTAVNFTKMNTLVDTLGDDITTALTRHLLHHTHPDLTATRRSTSTRDNPTIPTDIIETDTNYIFYLDIPGLSKSEIQVTVEDERTLVVKSNGKRKREDTEDEGCKILRLERRRKESLLRKFRLPDDADLGKIEAKCENGVLKISVGKNPPPPKGKTVQVKIA